MLNPGIYYRSKNAHRQLLGTLPGKDVYPTDSSFIHYSELPAYYVNFRAGMPVGDVVNMYVNGDLHGTTTILDSAGLYVYELPLTHGVLEIKSVFSDDNVASQTFYCVNLYTLLEASAEIWSEYRVRNMLILANNYLTPQTTGIFRGQADQQAMSDSFGAAIGFRQPPDWPFDRYALAMAGYPAMGLPGIYQALPKGSSTGAIKDVVQAVTQYVLTDDDFRLIQSIGWQLGRLVGGNYKYRYSGNTAAPVADVDPTNVNGPHYFLDSKYEITLPVEAKLTPVATIVGGTGPVTSVTAGVTYASQISIDGDQFDGPFFLPDILSSGAQIASVLQADMRRIGTHYNFGPGWEYCTVDYGVTAAGKYTFKSGRQALNGVIDGWTGGAVLLGLADCTSYTPGATMSVLVDGDAISTERFYAQTSAGVTKVWVQGVFEGQSVTINYLNLALGAETYTTTVPRTGITSPIASLRSDIQQAYTIMLRIVHNGFAVTDESVIRGSAGNEDYLAYNWLNPWLPAVGWHTFTEVIVNPISHTFDLAMAFQAGSEIVTLNGDALNPSQYTVAGTTIVLDPGIPLELQDVLQVIFYTAGPTVHHYEEEITGSPASPYTITFPSNINPWGLNVFVNGDKLTTTQYTITAADEIQILGPLHDGDMIWVRYFVDSRNFYDEVTHVGPKQYFTFTDRLDSRSVFGFVNGQLLPEDSIVILDDYRVRLTDTVYSLIAPDDVISIIVNFAVAGYNVSITQGDDEYLPGVHFQTDCTHGKIIWLAGAQPLPDTAYQVSYVYFPKQILEQLFRLVKPATIRLIMQFETTDGFVFNPFVFYGYDNPSGDVIVP